MDPITLTALALKAGPEITEHAALLIVAAAAIYKLVTTERLKPVIDYKHEPHYQDKTRYDRLCNLRRPLSINGCIPEQWELDENGCPKYKTKFTENARQLKKHVDALNVCDYPQKTPVSGLVSVIEHLFVSLSSKKAIWHKGFFQWRGYRSDGYEAMFFSDLAIWLSIDLPRYDIKNPQTAILLQEWITYCKEVQQNVLVFRADERSGNSPKELLVYLIKDLENLHKNICKANKAASFNDKIEHINVDFIDMAKNVFNLFHLLLEDREQPGRVNHPGIHVSQFLAHNQPTKVTKIDPNVDRLVKYQMGGWIAETFRHAGIRSCSFVNELPIKIDRIPAHINTDFSKIKNLSATGLWKFSRENRSCGEGYLKQIAELHRLLLMFYYVRDSVVMGATVSRDLGNAWVYGEDTGREIVELLLNIIADASGKLNESTQKFWVDFYINDYLQGENTTDNIDICNRRLGEADKVISRINTCHESILRQLSAIRTEASAYTHENESTEQKVQKLKECLHSYAIHTHLIVDASLLASLSGRALSSSTPIVIERLHYITSGNVLMAEEEIKLDYNQDALPFYYDAAQLNRLNFDEPLEPPFAAMTTRSLPNRPAVFHSPTQQNIFDHYLVPSHKAVNVSPWLSYVGLGYIAHAKRIPFNTLYTFVNSVMNRLYPSNAISLNKVDAIETALIDMLLFTAISSSFEKNKFFTYNYQWQEPPLEAEMHGGRVQIRLNKNWSEIATGLLAKELKTFTAVLNEQEEMRLVIAGLNNRISELVAENKALETKLVEKDTTIAIQVTIIESKEKELMDTKDELIKTHADLEILQSEFSIFKSNKSLQPDEKNKSGKRNYARFWGAAAKEITLASNAESITASEVHLSNKG